MNHPSDYRGKEVVVLGLARSGVAVAKLFRELGAVVTVNDKKERRECPEADQLEALGISVVCGGHPETLVHPGVSLLVKNPGIPYSLSLVQRAQSFGIEIVTEVEVAYHICRAPIIGITGSNGKTTTTTWIGKMLEAAGRAPIVAGNIGRALCEAAQEASENNWMVVELSSFQLKGTKSFRPCISCLLNVAETHLDYHGTMEDYIASKAKLFANQTEEDVAVINGDDDVCRRLQDAVKASLLPFSAKRELSYGVFISSRGKGKNADDRRIVYRDRNGTDHPVLPVSELGVPGDFNAENALAATAVAIAAGVGIEAIAPVLREFRGVEHRLEFVAVRNEVAFYNNSKATNPAATAKAIEAIGKPVVLIAGGLDRGLDFMDLIPCLKDKVKAVVTLGETKEKIGRVAELAGISLIKSVDNGIDAAEAMGQAVKAAYAFAEKGDVVLLSPACASWDMYASYEERGRIFKESVHNL